MYQFNNWMPDYAAGMQPNSLMGWGAFRHMQWPQRQQWQPPQYQPQMPQQAQAFQMPQFQQQINRQALQQPVKNAMYSTPQNPYGSDALGSGVARWGA